MTSPFPHEDRDALKEFVVRTHTLLAEIVANGGPNGGPSFVPSDLQPFLRDAWPTAGNDLLALRARIDGASDDALSLHGLSGPSLQFKLGVVQRAWSNS